MRARGRSWTLLLVAVMLIVPLQSVAGALYPQEAPEPALLSAPLPRGDIHTFTDPVPFKTPSAKTVDGDPADWVGNATRLGGTSVVDRGELVYQDFLFDAHGADDGKDRQRLEALGEAYDAEERLRRLEALSQAAEEQFGAGPADPTDGVVVSPPRYGDAAVPDGLGGVADLVEARYTVQEDQLLLMVRTAVLHDPGDLAVLLLAATDHTADGPRTVPFNSGLTTGFADVALLVTADGVRLADLADGTTHAVPEAAVAVDATGYRNTLEASVPLSLVAAPSKGAPGFLSLALSTGLHDGQGALLDVATGEARANVLNVAFRHEATVSQWFDRDQALALLEGRADHVSALVADHLREGLTLHWAPLPGYHERIMRSTEAISSEQGLEGVWQHYGLYIPPSWVPDQPSPMTLWLHWRGGTAHQAGAWTPRVFQTLGDDMDAIVVSPRGRGTSTWYVGAGHVDVLEAWDDVHALLSIDEDRRYVSGYSMGGFGSYLFGFLYPDRFAAAYPISGAVTQGAWLGVDDQGRDVVEANGGDANAELMVRLAGNARNLPYVIHHGTNDELVPVTGVVRMAEAFARAGQPHRLYLFPGYEHYTQAVVDEWAEGARYMASHQRDASPRSVSYTRSPALEHALETINDRGADLSFSLDGAYWLSGLTARKVDLSDPTLVATVEATFHEDTDVETCVVPEAGAAAPGHSTPFVMTGLRRATGALCGQVDHPWSEARPDRLVVTLVNAATANLDVRALQDGADGFRLEAQTDGPATVTVVHRAGVDEVGLPSSGSHTIWID